MSSTTLAKPSTKEFSWSFSRLKAYEDCARRFHETQVLKAWPEEESEQLKQGNAVHAALATALKTGTPLPTKFQLYQHWVDKVVRTDGELLVEDDCQLACSRDFVPVPWFSKSAWCRVKADAVKLGSDIGLLVDWKNGRSDNGDPVQLVLSSLMMFIHFPQLLAVRSDFIWLQEDRQTTQMLYRFECADAWASILPRVDKFQQAMAAKEFPPTPNRYCRRWCPVKSCEFNGK